jgi:large subunit ribosomal protein L5
MQELALITGQRAIATKANKSIAGFKIRQGMKVGALVTLRGKRMHTFLTKLIHIVIPCTRDFRGLSMDGFDGLGNYTLGITEQLVFPEVSYDYVQKVQGFGISIVTTAKTDSESFLLLRALGLPLK